MAEENSYDNAGTEIWSQHTFGQFCPKSNLCTEEKKTCITGGSVRISNLQVDSNFQW